MDKDKFNIYIDRLRNGAVEKINILFSSDILDAKEAELSFSQDVSTTGEVYTTDDSLVCHLNLETIAKLPCSICNQPTDFPLNIKGLYHVEALEDLKAGVYSIYPVIRESILLECPQFTECHEGDCPERQKVEKYINQSDVSEDGGYQPFSDLTLQDTNN